MIVTIAELDDFDEATGHRRDCPLWKLWPDVQIVTEYAAGEPLCSCAKDLYALLVDRSAIVADKVGPIDGDHVLVIRRGEGIPTPFGDELVKNLVRRARDLGLTGPLSKHVPLVVMLPIDGTMESLDEDEMKEHGWQRIPT